MTEPDQQPDMPAALRLSVARHALDAALGQLLQPTTETLTRADPVLDDQTADLYADERTAEHELEQRHARHLRAGHHAQAARTLAQLIDHRRRVEQRRNAVALTTTAGHIPALLDQLLDAVATSGNTGGGNSKAAAHRQAIGLAAAEQIHHIQREVRHRHDTLAAAIRAWADRTEDHDLARAATLAQAWADNARVILDPPKRWNLSNAAACPNCGNTTANVLDDTGEEVIRPAIEFDPATARARCLRCPRRWTTEAELRSLARCLLDDDDT